MAAVTAPVTVFLAGFGGPESIDEVPGFVESVLGRKPPDHVVPEVVKRYETIGGGSPLPGTTRRQAALLEKELVRRGHPQVRVHVGMLHARPTIAATADLIVSGGVEDVVVVSLAPYRCEVSTDAYEQAVADALGGRVGSVRFAADWNLSPRYVQALAQTLAAEREAAPGSPVIFAAHSLPRRMIDQGDPYASQLLETAAAVAAEVGLEHWELAYQSVSAAAREPWLGPSVEEAIDHLVDQGASSVVVDPIGFIADHVETLYDNDVEHRAHADAVGIGFHRCPCLNEHQGLIGALADVVEGAIA